MAYVEYKPIIIEAVYPNGEVRVRNRFLNENAACRAGDPRWPRDKLFEMAKVALSRWNESYGNHSEAKLRISIDEKPSNLWSM